MIGDLRWYKVKVQSQDLVTAIQSRTY